MEDSIISGLIFWNSKVWTCPMNKLCLRIKRPPRGFFDLTFRRDSRWWWFDAFLKLWGNALTLFLIDWQNIDFSWSYSRFTTNGTSKWWIFSQIWKLKLLNVFIFLNSFLEHKIVLKNVLVPSMSDYDHLELHRACI